MSSAEITRRIGHVSERAVRYRIERLIRSGVIRVSAIVNPQAVGFSVIGDVLIDVAPGKLQDVAAQLVEIPTVSYLAGSVGEGDLSVQVYARDTEELLRFVNEVIGKVPGVTRTKLAMVPWKLKDVYQWQVPVGGRCGREGHRLRRFRVRVSLTNDHGIAGRGLVGEPRGRSKGGNVAEELAFARKASGLVRGLSMMDAFAVGFMNQGLTPSIWFTISLGLGVFMGGNLIIACIISAVLAGIGFPIVWGVLGGSMPRSGGEYVYNSRIIHPIYGIAQSFGDAAIWLMWIFVLAPLAVDPGLTTTFNYMGLNGAANWITSSTAVTLLMVTVFNILGFIFVVFGIRIFALTQKIVMFFGIGGCIVIGLVLTFSSHANFVSKWNTAAAATHSANYNQFIVKVGQAAGQLVPHSWSWGPTFGCMVAMSWLFAYAYSISFIGGEVKRPRQDHHLVQPLRHRRAVRLHAVDRHRARTGRSATSS